MTDPTAAFTPSDRSRARRRPQRAAYDEASVYDVLDAGLLAHIGYVIDGQPFVTPTAYWREGRTLYWHGSSAGRMIAHAATGAPVCVTVSFLDGLIVGRSGFAHSFNYRSATAFGVTRPITGAEEKRAAMDAFISRIYPGRPARLRPATEAELGQITVIAMEIEEAVAKSRAGDVAEIPADAGWPAWFGVLPVGMMVSAPVAAPGAPADLDPELAHLTPGMRLGQALAEAQSALPVSA